MVDAGDDVPRFVAYHRDIASDHPDRREYRRAMQQQGEALIRVTPERCGPVASGVRPPELA